MTGTEIQPAALAVSGKASLVNANGDWETFLMLPCRLTLEVPVPNFTVAALLRLAVNDVVDTHWLQGSDAPLRVNGTLIGWTEFEVIDDHLAARLTQIA